MFCCLNQMAESQRTGDLNRRLRVGFLCLVFSRPANKELTQPDDVQQQQRQAVIRMGNSIHIITRLRMCFSIISLERLSNVIFLEVSSDFKRFSSCRVTYKYLGHHQTIICGDLQKHNHMVHYYIITF